MYLTTIHQAPIREPRYLAYLPSIAREGEGSALFHLCIWMVWRMDGRVLGLSDYLFSRGAYGGGERGLS